MSRGPMSGIQDTYFTGLCVPQLTGSLQIPGHHCFLLHRGVLQIHLLDFTTLSLAKMLEERLLIDLEKKSFLQLRAGRLGTHPVFVQQGKLVLLSVPFCPYPQPVFSLAPPL